MIGLTPRRLSCFITLTLIEGGVTLAILFLAVPR